MGIHPARKLRLADRDRSRLARNQSRRGSNAKVLYGPFLLDRDDPTKVIGRLPEPLIKPNANERDGYVPNVVYSCGSLVHGRRLVIPYGISDYATTFATLPLDQVLAAME
jgi:predicted GH43/DUF377 family glycosyl hydrolase